jgi:hypothetical protein
MVVVVGNAGGRIGRNSGELRDTQSSPEQKNGSKIWLRSDHE